MKKSALILVFLLVLTAMFASCGGQTTEVTIEYGESYSVPFYSGCSYTLKNSKNKEIELYNYTFFVDDFGGYTLSIGGKNLTIHYKVVDSTAPIIRSEYPFKFVYKLNEKVVLPTINVTDNSNGETNVSYKLTNDNDGAEVSVQNGGFIPTEYGQYTLTVSATDEKGNMAKKEVYYNVTSDYNELTSVIANFSGKNGVNHIVNERGINVSYNDQVKFANEMGSTALYVNGDSWFQVNFQLHAPLIYDLTNTKGFGLNVYNALNTDIFMTINWAFVYTLPKGQWTEVFIPAKEYGKFATCDSPMFSAKSDIDDITGMYFALYTADGTGLSKGSVHFSDMYVVNDISTNGLANYAQELSTEVVTENNMTKIKTFFKVYNSLSANVQASVTAYDAVYANYVDYMIDKYQVTDYQDTYISFSNEIGLAQTVITNAGFEINDEKSLFSGEKTLELISASAWYIQIDTEFFLTDNEYNKISFYVWAPEYSTYKGDYKFYLNYLNETEGVTQEKSLVSGWNHVEIDLNGGFKDGYFNIYCGVNKAWEDMLPSGLEFRITDIKGVN